MSAAPLSSRPLNMNGSRSVSIGSLLEVLDKVRETHNGWMACCPAHDDHDPSLSIALGDDDRILLHCFAGCELVAITDALGIEVRDLFPEDDFAQFVEPRSAGARSTDGAGLLIDME